MKNIEVPETKTASFECEVSHFNVPSMWLKNGVEIEMSEKFKIVVQGKLHQLIIMNTSTEDSAEYTFVCGNDQVSATLKVTRKLNRMSSRPVVILYLALSISDQLSILIEISTVYLH